MPNNGKRPDARHRQSPLSELGQSRAAVAAVLDSFRKLPGHEVWMDEISLVGSDVVDLERVKTLHQVTDTYLLALAVVQNVTLA